MVWRQGQPVSFSRHMERKLEGILNGILMEFHICEFWRIRTKSQNRCTFHGTSLPVFMVVAQTNFQFSGQNLTTLKVI